MVMTKDDMELTLKQLKSQRLQSELQLEALKGSIDRFETIIDNCKEVKDEKKPMEQT